MSNWEHLTNGKWEILPHVIGVDIPFDLKITPYQVTQSIPIASEIFLLTRINIRHNAGSIKICKSDKVYYESPGWLHYVHHDVAIMPNLLMTGEGWYVDIRPVYQEYLYVLQIALIGERAVKL